MAFELDLGLSEGQKCAACGSSVADPAQRLCAACGAPLAAERAWLLRANLQFVLQEMRWWQATRRLPEAELSSLIREYSARRDALDAPLSAPAAPPPLPPETPPVAVPAPPDPTAPSPVPSKRASVAGLAAFFQANNIAAIHLIGALLVLAGLIFTVFSTWESSIGKTILLAILLALTGGLSLGGRRVAKEQPLTGLALSALGALIAPLNPVAWNLVNAFGMRLPWNGVGLAAGVLCAGMYTVTLRRTRHPLFAGFLAAALTCAALFAARLLVPDRAHLTYAAAFVPLSALFFAAAYTLRRSDAANASRLALTFAGALWTNGPQATALAAAAVAMIYAVVAVAFRLPFLAYAASAAALIAGQMALSERGAALYDRAVAATLTALLLETAASLHTRFSGDDAAAAEVAAAAAGAYRRVAAAAAFLAVLPFAAVITAGYAALRPVTAPRLLVESFISLLVMMGLMFREARRENSPAPLYAALAAGGYATAALVALLAPRMAYLPAVGVPALLFATLCGAAAVTLRRGGNYAVATACDHAALFAAGLSALLPWAYFAGANGGILPLSLRSANVFVVLPGFAALNIAAACAAGRSGQRRSLFVHAAALSLGSLALLAGATGLVPLGTNRALAAAVCGAALAVAGGVIAVLWPPGIRRALSTDAAVLAAVATLPILPLVTNAATPLPLAGTLCLLAAAWALAAHGSGRFGLLYPAAASTLVAARLASDPWTAWGTQVYGWEPNETRWLLVLAPAFAVLGYLLRRRGFPAEAARPLYYGALAAAIWSGIGQIGMALSGSKGIIVSPAVTLSLLAAGLGIYGAAAQRKKFVSASLVPLAFGYLALLAAPLPASPWPWIAAAVVLSLFGTCYLWVAWEHGTPLFAGAGGLAVFGAYAHVLAEVLPRSAWPAAPICLAPCFVLLFALGRRFVNEVPALRRPLHGLALWISAVCIALFLFALPERGAATLAIDRAWFLANTLVYAALYAGAGILRREATWLYMAVIAGTAGMVLRIGGYPQWEVSAAFAGFWLAATGAVWLGAAALLARARWYDLAEALTAATLWVTTLGAGTALLGVLDEGRWTVFTLMVAGTVYGVVGILRQKASWGHAAFAAFAAYFGAFALFLYDGVGLSIGTADFFLIPVGLYLILVGALVGQARPDEAGRNAAQRLYAAGLFVALTPTFLAAWWDAAWWHSFLLVAQCVGSVYWGIARRIRVFLGIGIAFLVALLGVKVYRPLGQIHFGVYLTLLGAAVLFSAYFFERRREELRRWAQTTRAAFDAWE